MELTVQEILGNYSYAEQLEILEHGCISGAVSEMIYYTQTEEFFDKHSTEILELIEENREFIDFNKFEFTKNAMAWYAFDCMVARIVL